MKKSRLASSTPVDSGLTGEDQAAAETGLPQGAGPGCGQIAQRQNQLLAENFRKKVNTLSCRCSGCPGDGRLPVIASPADAPLLNTAYDGQGGVLGGGSTDTHWEVGTNGDASNVATNWSPATVVVAPPVQWVNSPYANASWLFNEHGTRDAYLYYRIRFDLGSGVNPATFALLIDFYADNFIEEIWINGAAQSGQPGNAGKLPGGGYGPGDNVQMSLDNHWRRCDNEIVVKVHSVGSPAGLLVQNAVRAETEATGCDCDCNCQPAPVPELHPCITVKWGDSRCDCLESDDVEVLSISVCNCYSNVTFEDFGIGQIVVTDAVGNPVPVLPDGTPSVEAVPSGPICFGDIGPCVDKDRPSCVTREFVLHTRGAAARDYRITFRGICFRVCHHYQHEQCFNVTVCADRQGGPAK